MEIAGALENSMKKVWNGGDYNGPKIDKRRPYQDAPTLVDPKAIVEKSCEIKFLLIIRLPEMGLTRHRSANRVIRMQFEG